MSFFENLDNFRIEAALWVAVTPALFSTLCAGNKREESTDDIVVYIGAFADLTFCSPDS